MAIMLKESSYMGVDRSNEETKESDSQQNVSPVGRNLPRYMQALGISMRKLDRMSEVSVSTIAKWISGKTPNPRRPEVEKVAKALGVTVEDLYREHDENIEGEELLPDFKFPVFLSQLYALYPDLPREEVRRWAEDLLNMDAEQLRFQIRAAAVWSGINLERDREEQRESEGTAKPGPQRTRLTPRNSSSNSSGGGH